MPHTPASTAAARGSAAAAATATATGPAAAAANATSSSTGGTDVIPLFVAPFAGADGRNLNKDGL